MTAREPLNIASLLRISADGELTAEQRLQLEAHLEAHPEDDACVGFERSLRVAVTRSMASERAPAGLADRVRSALAESALSDGAEKAVPLVETIAPRTRERTFWASVGGRLAVAAAFVLLASGSWYAYTNVFGASAEGWRSEGSRAQLASFLSREHMSCCSPARARQKFTVSEIDGIDASCMRIIKQAPRLDQLFERGGTLIGLGKCGVPGPGNSVHMQVRVPAGLGTGGETLPSVTVSLFIQQALDREGIDPMTSYSLDEAKNKGYEVDVWERGGLIYYLVCETSEASEAAREALGVLTPNQSL